MIDVYFATSSGLIVAIRERGQVSPRPLRNPKAQPFGYIPPDGLKITPAGAPTTVGPVAPDETPPAEGDKDAAPKKTRTWMRRPRTKKAAR